MDIPTDLLTVIFKLSPGFLAAWIFSGLTPYRKPSPFERMIQALVFTTFIEVGIVCVRELLFFLGRWIELGKWTSDSQIVTSIIVSLILGLLFAALANNSTVHDILWKLKITHNSSYPSEWFEAFARKKKYVTLHLKDERRILGWPSGWPNYHNEGQFVLENPSWLCDKENNQINLENTECIIIEAEDVEFVEFLKDTDQPNMSESKANK